MFEPVFYENTTSDEQWVSLCAIASKNPPYQSEFAFSVGNTIIDYQLNKQGTCATIKHSILNSNTDTFVHSFSTPDLALPNNIAYNDLPIGWVFENGILYPCIKLGKNESTICFSNSVGAYAIVPKTFDSVTKVDRISQRQLINFSGMNNIALYGVDTLTNVPSTSLSSFVSMNFWGLLMYRNNTTHEMHILPFAVSNGTLYFEENEIGVTGVINDNVVTFTFETSGAAAIVTFG